MLNPGRSCTVASQCKSRNCQEVCIGYEKNDACYEHADCVENHYCHQNEEWPFKTICKEYRQDGDVCTEDYQCQITHYCWYKTVEDRDAGTKKCMEMYSQEKGTQFGWYQDPKNDKATLEEYTQNGKYCLSGLAFKKKEGNIAQCTTTDKIMFDFEETNAPYNCTATDPNKKCQIAFE